MRNELSKSEKSDATYFETAAYGIALKIADAWTPTISCDDFVTKIEPIIFNAIVSHYDNGVDDGRGMEKYENG